MLVGMRKGCKLFCVKQKYLKEFLGDLYLFEILYDSLTVNTSKNMVKYGCFQQKIAMESVNFI